MKFGLVIVVAMLVEVVVEASMVLVCVVSDLATSLRIVIVVFLAIAASVELVISFGLFRMVVGSCGLVIVAVAIVSMCGW